MLNCRQVTRLVSRSMDERLPWHLRLGVRIHLLYCVWCRRYLAQVRFLRIAARRLANGLEDTPDHTLSQEAKAQIQARLRKAMSEMPPPSQ